MARWALTGGIASGKSTVARMFVAQGMPVVDADSIYHKLIAPVGSPAQASPLALRVAAAFDNVLLADGRLDRQALGAQVFSDPTARVKLEAITHPAVHAQATAECEAHEARGAAHVLYDIPLLFERNLQQHYAGVILVWVPFAKQRERLIERDGLNGEAADLRLASQWPLEHKKPLADHIIDNSSTAASTLAQVNAIVKLLAAR